MNDLLQKLSDLEKEGITAAFGESFLFPKKGKHVCLSWSNLHLWPSAKPCGSFSEYAEFSDYNELPAALSEAIENLTTRRNTFLAGGGI